MPLQIETRSRQDIAAMMNRRLDGTFAPTVLARAPVDELDNTDFRQQQRQFRGRFPAIASAYRQRMAATFEALHNVVTTRLASLNKLTGSVGLWSQASVTEIVRHDSSTTGVREVAVSVSAVDQPLLALHGFATPEGEVVDWQILLNDDAELRLSRAGVDTDRLSADLLEEIATLGTVIGSLFEWYAVGVAARDHGVLVYASETAPSSVRSQVRPTTPVPFVADEHDEVALRIARATILLSLEPRGVEELAHAACAIGVPDELVAPVVAVASQSHVPAQ